MAAVGTFVRKQLKRLGWTLERGIDVTDARVVFLVTLSDNDASTTFRAWASGDESIQLDFDNASNVEVVQWSVCPASRFNPAADSDPNDGKFIFVQFPWWNSPMFNSTITKWLAANWWGTPKDVGIIYQRVLTYNNRLPSFKLLLSDFHNACKAANLSIHPLRTVFLSTGWTEENCRKMYKNKRKWIADVKTDIRKYPDYWAEMIHGEPRFARLIDEHDSVIATVNLLFAPDSGS